MTINEKASSIVAQATNIDESKSIEIAKFVVDNIIFELGQMEEHLLIEHWKLILIKLEEKAIIESH